MLRVADFANPNFASWGTTGSSGTYRSQGQWIKEFGKHALLYPPVNRIATDIAGTRWGLYREKEDGTRIEIKNHPALALFENPSPRFLGWQLRYLIQTWLELTGEAYVLIAAVDKFGQPAELLPVAPHWVIRRPREDFKKYQILLPYISQLLTVPESRIIRLFNPDPYSPYQDTLGAAYPLDDELAGDDYAGKWNNAFFRNAATPDTVIGIDGDDAGITRLQASWNEKYQGVYNAHKAAFVNTSNLRMVSPSKTQREMDFRGLRDQNRDRVDQVWNIPPEILGIVENSNRATAEAAMRMYQTNVLKPRLEMSKAAFNTRLLPLFLKTTGLYYDFENPVQESKEFILEQSKSAYKDGAISRNEFRKAIGYNPTPDEDGYLIPRNMEFVPVGQKPQGKINNGNGKALQKVETA